MTKNWRVKAHKRIAELCLQSFQQTNQKKNGSYYKKRRPYAVPDEARALVDALGDHDQKAGELKAKSIFVYGWNGYVALSHTEPED